ncbi:endonuclease/exonuclease/phosphatase family protein [Vibrio sp. E150_011]
MWLLLLFLPTLVGAGAFYAKSNWVLENAASFAILFPVFYTFCALGLLICKKTRGSIVAFLLAGVWGSVLGQVVYRSTHFYTDHSACTDETVNIVQYNVYYDNQNLEAFIEYVADTLPDILVLQEVSPIHGERLQVLEPLYPYKFGGQSRVGYPSGQMILSRKPLYGMNTVSSRSGHKILKVIWRATADKDVYLIAAHPPSPRTEQLWVERNEVIRDVAVEAQRSPLDTTLVVGDFNLASTTSRFTSLMSTFDTKPVFSWPTFVKRWGVAFQPVVAIDHLWIRTTQTTQPAICYRHTVNSIAGSDHRPVRTYLNL